jgi:photosystem II stability/assembly factor-like uncharacterized protein
MVPRARRALAAVGVAAAVVVAVGMTYLRPWQALAPAPSATGRAAPVRPVSVQQAQFLSATLGWVVTGDTSSSTLFRTVDGGRHWQRQLAGVAGQGWHLRFFDARHGVVYAADKKGVALWRTADGGKNWTSVQVPTPTAPGLIFFADPGHGWCLGAIGGPPFAVPIADHQEFALFRTVDGGTNWSEVLRTDQPPASHGLDGDGLKTWIWFRDLKAGLIGQTTPGGHAVVYATVDGGDDWTRDELPPPTAGWGSPVAVFDLASPTPLGAGAEALVVAPVVQGPDPGTYVLEPAYVYTWPVLSSTTPARLPGSAFSVVGRTEGRRWWVTSGSTLLQSDDAGDHWLVVGEGPTGRFFSRFEAVDRKYAWALLLDVGTCGFGVPCVASLARTADGGRHWTIVSTP